MRIFLILALALGSAVIAAEPQLSDAELRSIREGLQHKLQDTVVASIFSARDNPHNMVPRCDPLSFIAYKEVLGGSWTIWNKTLQGELRSFENKTGLLLGNEDALVMGMKIVYQRLEAAALKDATLYPRLQACINNEMPLWDNMDRKEKNAAFTVLMRKLETK